MRALLLVLCLAACREPDVITAQLTATTFATSGGNLFNCTSPEFSATHHAVATSGFGCTPKRNGDGTFSTTPVTTTTQVGCADGHGAAVILTCAGIAGSSDVTGTAKIVLSASCDSTSESAAVDGDSFTFTDLAPGGTQSGSLTSCADYGNACPTSNACAFNAFSATVTVIHVAPKK